MSHSTIQSNIVRLSTSSFNTLYYGKQSGATSKGQFDILCSGPITYSADYSLRICIETSYLPLLFTNILLYSFKNAQITCTRILSTSLNLSRLLGSYNSTLIESSLPHPLCYLEYYLNHHSSLEAFLSLLRL